MSNNRDLYIKATSSSSWTRPSDWLDIDSLVTVGQHKGAFLLAVFPDKPSTWMLSLGQAFTVKVDGVATNYISGAQATSTIDYASCNPATTTSEGFRQVIIEIYPQVSPANTGLSVTNPRTGFPTIYPLNYIDVRLSFPNITSMFMNSGLRMMQLRRWTWLGTVPAISRGLAFNSPYLQEVNEDFSTCNNIGIYSFSRMPEIIGDITNNVVTTVNTLITGGYGNRIMGNLTFNNATTASAMINGNYTTEEIGNISLPAMLNAFSISTMIGLRKIGTINLPLANQLTIANTSLETVGNITTGANLTNITNVVNGSRLLKRLYISNCTNVTTTTTALSVCNSLQELYLGGLTRGITVPPCQMDDAAFAAFFNSLGIAAGAQTIVITGNITLSAPTLAIATGKGFTITP